MSNDNLKDSMFYTGVELQSVHTRLDCFISCFEDIEELQDIYELLCSSIDGVEKALEKLSLAYEKF